MIFLLIGFAAIILTSVAGGDVYANLPHGKMFRNVKDFGAKGDGVTDDTTAFIRALDYGVGVEGEKRHGTVYIPPGIYRITDTLIIWKGTHLIGDTENPPVLFLPSQTTGFTNPEDPKPLIVTANGWGIDPKTRDWRTRLDTLGGSTNNTFYTSLRNIKIKVGKGNPGAIAIYWCVAQGTALRNVEIDGGDAYACIKTSLWGGGGVISDINIVGGQRGWEVDQTSQFLIRSAKFSQQSLYAIRLTGVWNFVFLDLSISNVPSGLEIRGGNCISLIDSSFKNISNGTAIIAEPKPASLFLQNITSEGVDQIVKGHLPAAQGRIGRWILSEEIYLNGKKSPSFSYSGDIRSLPSPKFPKMSNKIRSVTEFGAIPDDDKDDTYAIQKAINLCEELFFPSGNYIVSDTLHLKPNSKLFGEHPAAIVFHTDSPKFNDPTDPHPLIETPNDPEGRLTIVNLFFRMEGDPKGAYYFEWRVGEKSQMVDVYLMATPSQPFIWKVSGKGGGFFENLWWPTEGGAISGKTGAIITSEGRKWFYSWQHEHFSEFPVILRNASKAIICLVQFENDYPASLWIDNCRDITVYGVLSGNWEEMRPAFIRVDKGERIEIFSLAWLGAHNGVLSGEEMEKEEWPRDKPDLTRWRVIGAWLKE